MQEASMTGDLLWPFWPSSKSARPVLYCQRNTDSHPSLSSKETEGQDVTILISHHPRWRKPQPHLFSRFQVEAVSVGGAEFELGRDAAAQVSDRGRGRYLKYLQDSEQNQQRSRARDPGLREDIHNSYVCTEENEPQLKDQSLFSCPT